MNVRKLVRSLMAVLCLAVIPAASYAGSWSVGISVGFAPPPIPVYEQPPVPGPGYIWTPGYWAYADDDEDYYWVPGTWVNAPAPGLLWTPGYWEAVDEAYVWHVGYWGPHVGFYGGIDYGFGYFGVGFVGGYWRGNDFCYNRAVANVENVHVTNVYNNTTIVNNSTGERPSFNGPQGVHARPTGLDLTAQREPHRGWTGEQRLHARDASAVPALLASSNHGHPPIAATPRAAAFEGRGVVAARQIPVAVDRAGRESGAHDFRSANAAVSSGSGRYARSPAALRDDRTPPRTSSISARSDRPTWASTRTPAAAPWVSTPPARQSSTWHPDATARPDRPAIRATSAGRTSAWPERPTYAATPSRNPDQQWSRPVQWRASERAWQPPASAPFVRPDARPPSRQVESPPSFARAAPSGRGEVFRAVPAPRAAPVDQRRADDRHR